MHNTQGIILRSVKYGETSLICTIFTSLYGVQPFMVQGVRSVKASRNRSGLLQPSMLLDMVVYHQPLKNMQRMREYQPAVIYQSILENVVKNSVALFSVEVLLRLLPDSAPLPDLFDFVFEYFTILDKTPQNLIGNFPLFFIISCSRELGFELKGNYSDETPHLNLQEGGYTHNPPALAPFMTDEDCRMLSRLIATGNYDTLEHTEMTAIYTHAPHRMVHRLPATPHPTHGQHTVVAGAAGYLALMVVYEKLEAANLRHAVSVWCLAATNILPPTAQ